MLCGTGFIMSKQQRITKDFLSPKHSSKDGGQKYLEKIGSVVSKHSGEKIELEDYKFRVGSLKDTPYEEDLLEEWEQFYLPDEMKMRVIGVLENFPCGEDRSELVLMVCEDGKVFAYEDERLHLVAGSLKVLFESGVQFPSSKYYYCGQRFEDMTKEDWDKVKKSKEVMEKCKEYQDMLESMMPTLLKNLEITKPLLENPKLCRKSCSNSCTYGIPTVFDPAGMQLHHMDVRL